MSVPNFESTGRISDAWFFSPTIVRLTQEAVRMGLANSPVLISGDRGSRPERELLARTIHLHSPRATATFTKLSWEFLTESFIESQLFGNEKVGPTQRSAGLLRQTHRGSLYLEELTRFSLATQAKLFAFIETGQFPSSNIAQHDLADVRIIAGTCQPPSVLEQDDNVFPDLRRTLTANTLTIPPLRDRTNEIPEIARQLCQDICDRTARPIPSFTDDAIQALTNYPWPENTEELTRTIKSTVENAGDVIEFHDLPRTIAEETPQVAASPNELRSTLERVERSMIVQALQAAEGNQTRAAKALGISERLMGLRVRKYALTPKSYRTKL